MKEPQPSPLRAAPRRLVALAALATLGALGATTAGCALTEKSLPLVPRYFSTEPEPPSALTPKQRQEPKPKRGELRLHNVRAASHLKNNIVFQRSSHEVDFYEYRRWAELPEVALRRALARTLYEERRYRRVISGGAPSLDVELTHLEEVQTGVPRVRATVVALLLDPMGSALLEETVSVERPIPELPPGATPLDRDGVIVANLGAALQAVVEQVADRVDGALPR